jgi:hypothetical protein
MLSALAKAATTIATPETAGVGLMIVVPFILLAARRRLDAAAVFCMFAGAFALAEIGKKAINDHRPLAAAFVVTGLAALPVLQPYLRRLRLTTPAGAPCQAGPDRA